METITTHTPPPSHASRTRHSLTVTIRPVNRARIITAADDLGIPASRLVDLLVEGRLRFLDDGRVEVVSR